MNGLKDCNWAWTFLLAATVALSADGASASGYATVTDDGTTTGGAPKYDIAAETSSLPSGKTIDAEIVYYVDDQGGNTDYGKHYEMTYDAAAGNYRLDLDDVELETPNPNYLIKITFRWREHPNGSWSDPVEASP